MFFGMSTERNYCLGQIPDPFPDPYPEFCIAEGGRKMRKNPDKTSPTLSFATPTHGAMVSGSTLTVEVLAEDNRSIQDVYVELQGERFRAEKVVGQENRYSVEIDDITVFSSGYHQLTATAGDKTGNYGSTSITIRIYNRTKPTPHPDLHAMPAGP